MATMKTSYQFYLLDMMVGPAGIEPATNRLIVLWFIGPSPYHIFVTFIVAHFGIIENTFSDQYRWKFNQTFTMP